MRSTEAFNVLTILATAISGEMAVEKNKFSDIVKAKAKQIINKYIPDCAVIAKGAGDLAHLPHYYKFTEPYVSKNSLVDSSDGTIYLDLFRMIGNDSIKLEAFKLSGIKYVQNIVNQASLKNVEILEVSGGKDKIVSPGKNYTQYINWAESAILFMNEINSGLAKKKITPENFMLFLQKIEYMYFGSFKSYDKSIEEREIELQSKIISAAETLKTLEKERGSVNAAETVIKNALKAFNREYERSLVKEWFNSSAGLKKLYDVLYSLLKKYDKTNILNLDSRGVGIINFLYDIDYDKNKIKLKRNIIH